MRLGCSQFKVVICYLIDILLLINLFNLSSRANDKLYSYVHMYISISVRILHLCTSHSEIVFCFIQYIFYLIYTILIISASNWFSLEFCVIDLLNNFLMPRFIVFRFDIYSLCLCD